MTLGELVQSVAIYGPVAIVRGDVLACGALNEIWYDSGAELEEYGKDLFDLEVIGINPTNGDFTNGEPTLEIGIEWA